VFSWPRGGVLVFSVLVLFIAAVSVHDAMLVVLNEGVIAHFERNPLGRWLIELGGGEVWLFVLVKLAGTSIACAALVAIYPRWRRGAVAAAATIAAFQLGLLLYLSLA
jgi:hypothetical protein